MDVDGVGTPLLALLGPSDAPGAALSMTASQRATAERVLCGAAGYLERALLKGEPLPNVGNATIYDGYAGVAVAAHVLRAYGLATEETVLVCLERMMSHSNSLRKLGLMEGLSGVGWVMHHVGACYGMDAVSATARLDECVCHHLAHTDASAAFDLVQGSAGLVLYFLDRRHECTFHSINQLMGALQPVSGGGGLRWLWPHYLKSVHPFYEEQIGIAHGSTGALGVLAHASSDHGLQAYSSVQRPVWAFLLPLIVEELARIPDERVPVTWCWGTLGIGGVANAIEARGLEIPPELSRGALLREEAARIAGGQPFLDYSLCHGVAGAMHVLGRSNVEDDSLVRAVHVCLSILGKAFDGARHDLGLSFRIGRARGPSKSDVAGGLLTGVAGVALATLGLLHPESRRWDRLLLLS